MRVIAKSSRPLDGRASTCAPVGRTSLRSRAICCLLRSVGPRWLPTSQDGVMLFHPTPKNEEHVGPR
eukprot:6528924-Prymnesium_polylepis.1